MIGAAKRLSLVPRRLRNKLLIVFCLMSLIPVLVSLYLVSAYVMPHISQTDSVYAVMISLFAIMIVTVLISFLGFIVACQMVNPIIDMALYAKLVSKGKIDTSLKVNREDEIGELGASLNAISDIVKNNIEELATYGEKAKDMNIEVNKKIVALSGLLHVGNLIASGAQLESVLDILVEKVSLIEDEDSAAVLMIDKRGDGQQLLIVSSNNTKLEEVKGVPLSLLKRFFGILGTEFREITIDKRITEPDDDIVSIREICKLTNLVVLPIVIHDRLEGTLLIGNNRADFQYNDDCIELYRVFCRQAAIAIENSMLAKKAKDLEVRDSLTGLYNKKYISDRLNEEIRRAVIYQRPCSFLLLTIDNFDKLRQEKGPAAAELALKKIAALLEAEVTPIDRLGRFGDDVFALVLPERSKKEARYIAEELRKKVEQLIIFPEDEGGYSSLTVSGGLSENPIDGVSAAELINKAEALLLEAEESDKNTIRI